MDKKYSLDLLGRFKHGWRLLHGVWIVVVAVYLAIGFVATLDFAREHAPVNTAVPTHTVWHLPHVSRFWSIAGLAVLVVLGVAEESYRLYREEKTRGDAAERELADEKCEANYAVEDKRETLKTRVNEWKRLFDEETRLRKMDIENGDTRISELETLHSGVPDVPPGTTRGIHFGDGSEVGSMNVRVVGLDQGVTTGKDVKFHEGFLEVVGKGVPPTTLGRNDPCPCGSGKKFKKCHGTTT